MSLDPGQPRPSIGAISGLLLGASLLMLIGVLQVIAGIGAIVSGGFYIEVRHYAYSADPEVWGWLHLALGVLMVLTSVGLFIGKSWAFVAGIILAGLGVVLNFLVLPQNTTGSIVLIAMDLFVIWALTRPDLRHRAS